MADFKKKDEVTKPVLSVQVIHYICTNCSEEKEEIILCSSCKGPMRVAEVKEYFGTEAMKKLDEIRGKNASVVKVTGGDFQKVGIENGIVDETDNFDSLDELDSPKENKSSEDDFDGEWKDLAEMAGDEIFEEASNELNISDPKVVNNDELLALLDKEEEEGSDTVEELPDL